MATVYDDAELFTQKIIHLTKNNMQSNTFVDRLSPLAENLIRIMNLDVEDRFELYDAPSGKKVMLLFAKNTDIGYEIAYYHDRFIHQDKKVDVIVLPNDDLLNALKNDEILQALNSLYAFILETKRASAEYISPIEVMKHTFARYYFKFKYFADAFELDDVTVNDLKTNISDELDGMITYDDIMDAIKSSTNKPADYFNNNTVLEKVTSEVYYQIIDELSEAFEEQ